MLSPHSPRVDRSLDYCDTCDILYRPPHDCPASDT